MRLLLVIICFGKIFTSFSQFYINQIECSIVYRDTFLVTQHKPCFNIDLYPPSNAGDSLKWKIQGIDSFIYGNYPHLTLVDTGIYKVELFTRAESKPTYFTTNLVLRNDSLSKVKPGAFQCGYGCGNGYDLCFKSYGMKNFRAMIFNRWGELVFESGEPEITWEKRHYKTGTLLLAGTYYYIMQWTDAPGNHCRITNYWTFIR